METGGGCRKGVLHGEFSIDNSQELLYHGLCEHLFYNGRIIMKRTWIKIYLEILDDPKIGRLAVWLRWRFVELVLVAAESDQSGTLPPVTQLAWRLRVGEADLVKSLRSLSEIGVVCQQGGRWKVTNFEKRQAVLSGWSSTGTGSVARLE